MNMFPAKNFSPQQVAVVASLPIGLVGGLAIFFYGEGMVAAIIFFIFLSLISYISVYIMLQRFIYRKIKLIYKLIFQTKASKREEIYYRNIVPQKSIEEITKLESGEQLLIKENFVIQDIIKEVFESLSIKADEKKIKCFIKKGCELPLTVFGDKEKLRQVLINFIDNAIKYGKPDGTIEGSAYKIDGKKVLVRSEEHTS